MTSMTMMTHSLEDTEVKQMERNEQMIKEHDKQERWPEKRMSQMIWMVEQIKHSIESDYDEDRIAYLTDKALECARRHHREMVEDMEDRTSYSKTGKYDGYEGVSQ